MKYTRKVNKKDNLEKYGEFICSFYQWVDLDSQKENAKRLARITKNKEKDI